MTSDPEDHIDPKVCAETVYERLTPEELASIASLRSALGTDQSLFRRLRNWWRRRRGEPLRAPPVDSTDSNSPPN